MIAAASLPEVLQRRAATDPDSRAYVFLDEHGAEKSELTYRDLHTRALTIAAHLARHCTPGDRALLLFPQGPDFITAFLGCLYAGVVAVPASPPRRSRVQDATLGIVTDCEPTAVLTLAAMVGTLRPALAQVRGPLHWLAVDELPAADVDPEPPRPDSLAFLQYTSGSTSAPKGVMVTHRNLAANEEMIRRAFGHDEDSTVVGWAPFFHDQGLIGNVLQPLHVGATSILMSPMAFLRRPLLWLSAISRYRAHTSGGPNFAFDACAAHAARADVPDLDLSCWKVAFNGAEPVRPDTLRRFTETFAPFGFADEAFHPCYGLAEATLIVTGTGKGRGPRTLDVDAGALALGRYAPSSDGTTRTLAGSGHAVPGAALRLVDPGTGRPGSPDRIGEIQVAGDHVAQGYWRRPEATAETFRRASDGRTWLRTGDLGLLVDDELYVAGRLKDVVIIRGRNHYPQDIEETAQTSHPALRPGGCAAFAVPGADGERLVVVQEVRRDHRSEIDPGDVAGAIRAAVVRHHQVAVGDVVLTVPGRLPKTSSGKIMRSATRERYLDVGFEPFEPRRTADHGGGA
jgi:acyl-CoA synthetase (AMP-forming)/AMP-acid ligase II